jgi:hypothetical protein
MERILMRYTTKVLLALAACAGFAASAHAQTVLTVDWKIEAAAPGDTSSYLVAASDTARGMDVAGSTVFVASRSNGNLVRLINAADGTLIGTLDGSVYSGGTHIISRVGVADDGAVYVCNLALANGTFRLYRHADANLNTVATVANETLSVAFRTGDSMSVRGSGTGTVILLGCSGTTRIGRLTTTDGLTFTLAHETPTGVAGTPHLTFDREANDGSFWFRATNGTGGRYDANGTQLATDVPRPASTLYGPIDVNLFNGVKVIALGSGNVGAGNTIIQGELWATADLPTATAPLYVTDAIRPDAGTNANGNGAGAVRIVGNSVYFLVTNNTLSKSSLNASVQDWHLGEL